MNKEIVLYGSFIIINIVLILISYFINFRFIKKAKLINSIKNMLLGLELTLIGILAYYIVYNVNSNSIVMGLIVYFIPIYIITTGLMLSVIGYLEK